MHVHAQLGYTVQAIMGPGVPVKDKFHVLVGTLELIHKHTAADPWLLAQLQGQSTFVITLQPLN